MIKYYAVNKGRVPGIYNEWEECKEQVIRFNGAKYKRFTDIKEAEFYLKNGRIKPETALIETLDEYDIGVYTDGSCHGNGNNTARGGIGVYFGVDDIRNESQPLLGYPRMTNNIAELEAALTAFDILMDDIKQRKKVVIFTDSEYVIKCSTTYGDKQKEKEWSENIANKEQVRILYELFDKYKNVKLYHVKAHTGRDDIHSRGNAEADRLANRAI